MIKDQRVEFTGGKIQFKMRKIFRTIRAIPQLPWEGLCTLIVEEFKQRLKNVLVYDGGSPKTNYMNLCTENLVI